MTRLYWSAIIFGNDIQFAIGIITILMKTKPTSRSDTTTVTTPANHETSDVVIVPAVVSVVSVVVRI